MQSRVSHWQNRIWHRSNLWMLRLNNIFSRSSLLGDTPAIVSLTTYGDRLNSVALTLESIALGSKRPIKVILYVTDKLSPSSVPTSVRRLEKRGLEIAYVKDIGPHTKYFYALPIAVSKQMPFITIDDDTIYPRWWLDNIFTAFSERPTVISCFRARAIEFNEAGTLQPYNEWPFVEHDELRKTSFFTGVAGVLYPPAFAQRLMNAGMDFLKKCPKADDIWLNFIAAKSGTLTRQVKQRACHFPLLPGTQDSALWGLNSKGGNDEQISATYDCQTLEQLRTEASIERR